MADEILKTDYKDDVLDTSVNERRKYQMIKNEDDTISLEDVTKYLQTGDNFGSKDVNKITKSLNNLIDLPKQVELMDIQTSKEYTLPNSVPPYLKLIELSGNSEQNGEPTPSNPIAIKNVGDCVEMMQGYWNGNTGVYTTSSNYVCNKRHISCESGDTVKVECDNAEKIYIVGYKEDGTVSTYQTMGADGVEISSGVTQFAINVNNSNGITPQTVGKITLTINDKYVVPVKTSGKNLLSVNQFGEGDTRNSLSRTPISLKCGVTYKILMRTSATSGSAEIWFADENGKDVEKEAFSLTLYNSGKEMSYTPTKDIHYIYVLTNTECVFSDVMISEDGGDFEPYTEHTEYILLDEPIRGVGDVKDRIVKQDGVWGVERRVTHAPLADLVWREDPGRESGTVYYVYSPINAQIYKGICSHYSAVGKFEIDYSIYMSDSNYIYISDHRFAHDVDGFVAYLKEEVANGRPPHVDIISNNVEPTFTPLDTESQKALNRLVAFNGVTHIEVDSVVQPSGIEVEYGTSKVGALALENERDIKSCFQSVSDGKKKVASAITDKGVTTAEDATFDTMANNIGDISTLSTETADATAQEYHILKGLTAYARGSKLIGTMVNHGAVSQALGYGGSYTIPAGFHNGSGVITAPADKSLRVANIGGTSDGGLNVKDACNNVGIPWWNLTKDNFCIYHVTCNAASKSNINGASKVGACTMTAHGTNAYISGYDATNGIVYVTGCSEIVQLTDSSGNSAQYETITRTLTCYVKVYAVV